MVLLATTMGPLYTDTYLGAGQGLHHPVAMSCKGAYYDHPYPTRYEGVYNNHPLQMDAVTHQDLMALVARKERQRQAQARRHLRHVQRQDVACGDTAYDELMRTMLGLGGEAYANEQASSLPPAYHHRAQEKLQQELENGRRQLERQAKALEQRERAVASSEVALVKRMQTWKKDVTNTAQRLERDSCVLEAKAEKVAAAAAAMQQRVDGVRRREVAVKKRESAVDKHEIELRALETHVKSRQEALDADRTKEAAATTIQRSFRSWKATRADVRFMRALKILKKLDKSLNALLESPPSQSASMAEVLTKHLEHADAIVSDGNTEIRRMRKDYVRRVMRVLEHLDSGDSDAMSSGEDTESDTASVASLDAESISPVVPVPSHTAEVVDMDGTSGGAVDHRDALADSEHPDLIEVPVQVVAGDKDVPAEALVGGEETPLEETPLENDTADELEETPLAADVVIVDADSHADIEAARDVDSDNTTPNVNAKIAEEFVVV